MKNKTGTKEWAQTTINIQRGCEHGCRYCFARANALRFKLCTADEWSIPKIDQAKVEQDRRKVNGVVMTPSTHDITPRNLEQCMTVIEKLLAAGNQVLIVSKPSWQCITLLCDKLSQYKRQILFRFTIGSMSEDVLAFWEPNAPKFVERLSCLQYVYAAGYETSVSCEPYLDAYTISLYETLVPFVTESFWIGTLRKFKLRVDLSGVSEHEMQQFVRPLLAAQTDEAVRILHRHLDGKPCVKWKDSVREIIEKGA